MAAAEAWDTLTIMDALSALFPYLAPYLVVLALLATFAMLIAGVFTMIRRDKHDPRLANKLMRARIAFQALALILIALSFVLFKLQD